MPGLPVDGHVHLHACFDADAFLDAAAANFAAVAGGSPLGALLLTESAGVHAFRQLREGSATARWAVQTTGEPDSLLARHGDAGLILVAGRQLVTSESLEVLALACEADLPDGLPIDEAVDRVLALDGLPAVPWGFGKWWFSRGQVVLKLIQRREPSELFLGDNGGRPGLAGRPALLDTAERRGIRVLPGSDPLPFPSQVQRPGSFGFLVPEPLGLERPATELRRLLRNTEFRPEPYGRGERLWPFVRNQIAMQLVKRRPQAAA